MSSVGIYRRNFWVFGLLVESYKVMYRWDMRVQADEEAYDEEIMT
jgi:hypothetical protein